MSLFSGWLGELLAPTSSPTDQLLEALRNRQDVRCAALLSDASGVERFGLGPGLRAPAAPGNTTVLHAAAGAGLQATLRALLDHGADVAAVSSNRAAETPLHVAARSGMADACALLVSGGADPAALNGAGKDTFAVAVNGDVRAALSPANAPPVRRSSSPPPYQSHGFEETKGDDVPAPSTPPAAPSTPSHPPTTPNALMSPEPHEVMAACRSTAHALASPSSQWARTKKVFDLVTTGIVAGKAGHEAKLATLLERLARDPSLATIRAVNMSPKIEDGMSLLHAAAAAGNEYVLKALLEALAPDVLSAWTLDTLGRTALHVAATKGMVGCCALLCAYMAAETPDGRQPVGENAPLDLSGRTPVAWAALSAPNASRAALEETLFLAGDGAILPRTALAGRHTGPRGEARERGAMTWAEAGVRGWRVDMEDACCAHSPVPGVDADDAAKPPRPSLFAVLDGHGGAFASTFCAKALLEALKETDEWVTYEANRAAPTAPESEAGGDPKARADTEAQVLSGAMRSAVFALDEKLLAQPVMAGEKGAAEDASGSTLVCAMVTATHIIVANVGDSKAVLGLGSQTEWAGHDLNTEHKPNLPDEKERIEQAGAFVVDVEGTWRVKLDLERKSALAVSRALGDFAYKKNADLGAESQAVTCAPQIVVLERDAARGDELLLLACDGVWDVFDATGACEVVRQSLAAAEGAAPADSEALTRACDALCQASLERGSRDNISCLAVRLGGAVFGEAVKELF